MVFYLDEKYVEKLINCGFYFAYNKLLMLIKDDDSISMCLNTLAQVLKKRSQLSSSVLVMDENLALI